MDSPTGGIVLFAGKKRRKGENEVNSNKKARRTKNGGVGKSGPAGHTSEEQPPLCDGREEQVMASRAGSDDSGGDGLNEIEESDDERKDEIVVAKKRLGEGVFPEEDETFTDIGVSKWLSKTCETLGMKHPTAVQCRCVPQILEGRNVIGVAQTGSGKTAAFALPILQLLGEDAYGVFALLLAPTRELAHQVGEQFKALGVGMSAKVCIVVGGVDTHQQGLEISKRPHIVVATPGRLANLCKHDGQLSGAFRRLRFLVLDEADRLLDVAFEDHLRRVLKHLPPQRQTLLFSATMTKGLVKLQQEALKDAYVYKAYDGLKASHTLEQQYVFIPENIKETYLVHILNNLENMKVRSAIIFCSTCAGCKMLKCVLDELGFESAALHSQLMQNSRFEALDRFKSGRVPMLVATDVASRGLDIPTVDLVINFQLPVAPRDYVHRVGRTARAGRTGRSVSFITQFDIDLLHRIEKLIGEKLTEFKTRENEVLKGMNKVYVAKKAALLKIGRQDSLAAAKSKRKEQQR